MPATRVILCFIIMAEFMESTSAVDLPAVDRVKHFLDGIAQENASINILERKLLCEKHKRRKLRDKAKKLRYRVKAILEELKATEVEIDNATTNISNLEENLRNCEGS